MRRSSSPGMVALVVVALAVAVGVGWWVYTNTNILLGMAAGIVVYPMIRLPIWTQQIREAKRLAVLPSIPQEDFGDLGSIGRAVYISRHTEPQMDAATDKWQTAWRTNLIDEAHDRGGNTWIDGFVEAGELEAFWYSLYTEYHMRDGDVSATYDALMADFADRGLHASEDDKALMDTAIRSAYGWFKGEGVEPLSGTPYQSPYTTRRSPDIQRAS